MYSIESNYKFFYVNNPAESGGVYSLNLIMRGMDVVYNITPSLEYTTSRGSKFSFTEDIKKGTYDAVLTDNNGYQVKFTIYYTNNEHTPSIYD